jgi:hypothetical protein
LAIAGTYESLRCCKWHGIAGFFNSPEFEVASRMEKYS